MYNITIHQLIIRQVAKFPFISQSSQQNLIRVYYESNDFKAILI
jgi:hypothetical protein